jgi:hypothetical protein
MKVLNQNITRSEGNSPGNAFSLAFISVIRYTELSKVPFYSNEAIALKEGKA